MRSLTTSCSPTAFGSSRSCSPRGLCRGPCLTAWEGEQSSSTCTSLHVCNLGLAESRQSLEWTIAVDWLCACECECVWGPCGRWSGILLKHTATHASVARAACCTSGITSHAYAHFAIATFFFAKLRSGSGRRSSFLLRAHRGSPRVG